MCTKAGENIKNRTVTKMPESQNTEWKSKWKDEYLEWICGYANAQGGKIYIGCDDEGNVIGLSNARKLLENIPNKIRDAMGIIVGVNLLDKNGKEYIEIDVPPYPIGISCKGVYYYRSGSTRQILTGPALEALLNALCHKQYQSGVPIQISVYEDKLYIANCGCLPENWTLENLMSKHASSPYNPNIAHVFYLAGFIESWGRGIEKICSACEKDGVPQPEYTINPGDIMIKFTAPEDRLIRSVTGRVTEKVTDKVTDTLDETSLKILNLLAVDPAYTTTFLAENLSLSRKTVSLRLKMLKDAGLIERIGSDRKGYWKLLK